jgi:hypothetical protein
VRAQERYPAVFVHGDGPLTPTLPPGIRTDSPFVTAAP